MCRRQSFFALAGLSSIAIAATGKSLVSWDCCKPSCGWQWNLVGVEGYPAVCDFSNRIIKNGLSVPSGCSIGDPGYLCDMYQPFAVSSDFSIGFALMFGLQHCCRCYQLSWTSGALLGKSMTIQAINTAPLYEGVDTDDIVIHAPTGGSWPNTAGCRNQYGPNWPTEGQAVDNFSACARLPKTLQRGCYWQFDWAGGLLDHSNIEYEPIDCPKNLTSISGCSA